MCCLLQGGSVFNFHTWAIGPLKQTATKTCHISVVAQCSFRLVKNHAPQNMTFETRTLNLPPTKTCQVLVVLPNVHFDAWATQAPKTYPTKTCNILGAMFRPIHPSSIFPYAIPIHAPWPIHHVLNLFSTSHCRRFFVAEL
jgi:hypothetical protein